MERLLTLPERIRTKIKPTENGCWAWTGCRVRGYGHMQHEGRQQPAHRVVYELLVGPIPEGRQLDHLCRVRACVNPIHLEPVTCRENLLRGETLAAAQAAQTHCKRGHEFTTENTYVHRRMRRCRACHRERNRLFMRGAYARKRTTQETVRVLH